MKSLGYYRASLREACAEVGDFDLNHFALFLFVDKLEVRSRPVDPFEHFQTVSTMIEGDFIHNVVDE